MARTAGSHSDITGPRVRDAALRLFARDGYAAVSMRRIAGEVGVQAGALYNYTPDKQTLLFDLMRDHLIELLAAQPQDTGDAVAALERFVRFHIGFHHDRPDAVFIAYMELRSLSPAHYNAVSELRRDYENLLKAILQDGVDDGSFQIDDIHVTAMAILAMLTGITTWYRPGGRLSASAVEMQYAAMVRRMAVDEIGESLPVQRQAKQ